MRPGLGEASIAVTAELLGGGGRSGSPDEDRARTFPALIDLLSHVSGESMTALVLDDLHNADPGTLDFVSYLAARIAPHRALLLAASREPRRSLPSVRLAPLATDDAARLVRQSWLEGSVPAELLGSIVARGKGNPLFIIELCRHAARARRKPDLAPLMLPSTLRGVFVVAAATLPRRAQELLEILALFGTTCARPVLLLLARERGTLSEAEFEEALAQLLHSNLVQVARDGGAPAYRFRQDLALECLYDGIAPERRKRAHMRIASVLERELLADQDPVALRLLARQFEGAEEYERAMQYTLTAAQTLLSAHCLHEAAASFDHAVGLAARAPEIAPEMAARALHGRGQTLALTGRAEEARASFEAALAKAKLASSSELSLALSISLGSVAREAGDPQGGLRHLTEAVKLAKAMRDQASLARAYLCASGLYQALEDMEHAKACLDLAEGLASSRADKALLAEALAEKAALLLRTTRYDEALSAFSHSLALWQGLGRKLEAARVLGNLGTILAQLGRPDDALKVAEEAIHISRAHGDLLLLAKQLHNYAGVHLVAGRLDEARRFLGESLEIARSIEWTEGVAINSHVLESLTAAG